MGKLLNYFFWHWVNHTSSDHRLRHCSKIFSFYGAFCQNLKKCGCCFVPQMEWPHFLLKFSWPIPILFLEHFLPGEVGCHFTHASKPRKIPMGLLCPYTCMWCTVWAWARTKTINISLSSYLIETSTVLNHQSQDQLYV